jgi:hypothetical protein
MFKIQQDLAMNKIEKQELTKEPAFQFHLGLLQAYAVGYFTSLYSSAV